jgi:hypothetical protein
MVNNDDCEFCGGVEWRRDYRKMSLLKWPYYFPSNRVPSLFFCSSQRPRFGFRYAFSYRFKFHKLHVRTLRTREEGNFPILKRIQSFPVVDHDLILDLIGLVLIINPDLFLWKPRFPILFWFHASRVLMKRGGPLHPPYRFLLCS